MASSSTERTPLIRSPSPTSTEAPRDGPRLQRTVTFNPHTTISHPNGPPETSILQREAPSATLMQQPTAPAQPRLSTLNSKLRRRNSHGSPLATPPSLVPPGPKVGPQRTTKTAQKLKILPNPDSGEDGPDEESGRDVYSQFTRIKDPIARRDAARLGKSDRQRLPRVTAYCTASAYRMEALMKFLKSKRARQRGANPKQFDECIYTPYDASLRRASNDEPVEIPRPPSSPPLRQRERRFSDSALEIEEATSHRREDLIDITDPTDSPPLDVFSPDESTNQTHSQSDLPNSPDLDTTIHIPEVFLFAYGTVVLWGMTPPQETAFLASLSRFESEKLSPRDIQTEDFNFYYTTEYQARIYNDFISLRDKKNYMAKLAISHALAQSVKTSLFEELLATTIAATQHLPEEIAITGKVALSRKEIHQQIGQLFILRINIHLQGSVLDSPELMWAEPHLEPVYAAVRSYLEMDQRVGLLTERLSVIGDLLAVLKDQVGNRHDEFLEWIVIVLIAAEIAVATINIIVDLYAGVD